MRGVGWRRGERGVELMVKGQRRRMRRRSGVCGMVGIIVA